MLKKCLLTIVNLFPKSFQRSIRDRYWRIKSSLLYHYLYQAAELEWTLRSGLKLRVASKGEWWIYNDIFVNCEYDLAIQKALASFSSGQFTVLDLGANVGYFSLRVVDYIRQRHPEKLALDLTLVEGSPRNYRELQHRFKMQSIPEAGIRLIEGLVGERTGKGTIHESAIHVKNTIMQSSEIAGVSVHFVDLCEIMQDRPVIDLLKCDIEGAELLFVGNYQDLLARVKNAVFEFHHEQCDASKCMRLLEQAGFQQQLLSSSQQLSISFFYRESMPATSYRAALQ